MTMFSYIILLWQFYNVDLVMSLTIAFIYFLLNYILCIMRFTNCHSKSIIANNQKVCSHLRSHSRLHSFHRSVYTVFQADTHSRVHKQAYTRWEPQWSYTPMITSGFEIISAFQENRGFPSISEVLIKIRCLVEFTFWKQMCIYVSKTIATQ